MRALAAWIVSGPVQAVTMIVGCTVLSFLAPPLTSILGYVGAAGLALYTLQQGGRSGVIVMLAAVTTVALLTALLLQQGGLAVVATSAMLWLPLWLAAVVLKETLSLAMAILVLSGLAMLGVSLVYLFYGDPTGWWQQFLTDWVGNLATRAGMTPEDTQPLVDFVGLAAPIMTGALAAGLSFAAMACLVLGRWWQSLLVKPGALKQEFMALRLNRPLSLAGIAILVLAELNLGIVSDFLLQWALIVMVPFLFVGLAVVHATVANLNAGRGWLIGVYVLMSLFKEALLMVVITGVLDPWLDLRGRTRKTEPN